MRFSHNFKKTFCTISPAVCGDFTTYEEWEVINSADVKGKLRDIKNELASIERTAEKHILNISPFTFDRLEKVFFNQPIKYQSLQSAFDDYIERLNKNGQASTATAYQTAYNSLISYKKGLEFNDITVDFLNGYEEWILNNEKSITTVGIYLRSLRAILNLAKDERRLSQDMYPFGKRKYVIPTGKNIKKAISIGEIKQIFQYPTESHTFQDKAKDFWIFSYLCNGINFKDIAHLRWQQLSKTSIVFEREKTKCTKRQDPVKITAIRNSYIDVIIKKWSNKSRGLDDLVFDIIDKRDTPQRVREKVLQFTKVTNKWMKRMGEELGFELKLTTYVARHSFATILVRSGAPLEFASQSLGHNNLPTTQKYFAGFDTEAQTEFAKVLVDF